MFIMLLYKVLSNLKNVFQGKVDDINRSLFINDKFTFSMFTSGKMRVDLYKTSLVAQLVKNPPAMQKTWVRSLGWEDPLEKGKATTPEFWPGEFHGL